ncbi:KPN_02809 family neutral zinc metallopeptidase [Pararhodobacter zhoushanensis]|uniref:Zinc metallopeptidase n=1 Tax=Pararhodobacter zhoushanensis TaxID=2479545 RepID=A0ABT3H024_9RHOB|nr:neutral zinc metallopeptidase [Pararhodobacter zhoushanensis]MCW1933085.1 zinc metallopeptidase [Pararhodobacter zhoushanensis]
MQWRGKRTSSNIEDRRRSGGGRRSGGLPGIRIGGGGGRRGGGLGIGATIIVLLIGAYFGVDVSGLVGGSGSGPVASAPQQSGPNTIDDDQEAFVATILAETEQVWTGIFQSSGQRYTPTTLVLYQGGTASACGMAQSAMGPFYCPGDRKVYLDTDFFRVMEQQLNAGGEFANAYVIAHEVAHHVQNLTGILGQVNAQRERASERESNALSVRIELQADCYAGVWAHGAADRLAVTEADIRQALATAARIGDDALQQASGGRVVPDSFTHGTSEQRQNWFFAGYRAGDPAQCDTFRAASL